MANTLKIKRGTAATIPQGQLAEPLFTTDTYDLYIGKGSGGNQRIQNYIASGTSSQFLKGDGTLDSTSYQPLITAGTTLQYYRGDKTFQTLDTSVVPENGPIYFTEPRVRATVLTGLNLSGGGTIAATDSILTAFGKVQNQISALVGGATYQGTWNASTNTPTLASGTGTKGYYYVVSVAGSTNLDGITDWKIGDWAIFNGTTWDKVDNTDAVSSVNGFTGAVNLALDNISDVSAASPTNAQLLRFNGTSSLWENWTPTFEPALTKGNLTSGDTSYLTVSGGTGAVIGSGTTISILASGIVNGGLTLTTTGNSGAATKTFATLNIPEYTLAGLGGVPTTRTITINGTAQDLSADRSWSVGTITGSGTTSYVPKFTGASAIGNSQIVDDGTSILIGVTSDQGILQINGAPAGGLMINASDSQFGIAFKNSSSSNKKWDFSPQGNNLQFNESGVAPVLIFKAGGGNNVRLYSYASNGFLKTSASDGTLVVDTTSYLPLTGGTLTGALSGTSATFNFVRSINETGFLLRNDANSANLGGLTRRSYWAGGTAADTQIFAETGYAIYLNPGGSSSIGLTLASTGAATFSSSVTAATNITCGTGAYDTGGFFIPYSSASASSRNWKITNDQIVFGDFSIKTSSTQTGLPDTYRFYINASGNVGIGTTSPEQLLTVAGGSISVSGNTGLPRQILELTTASTVAIVRASYQGAGSYGDLALWSGGSERMRITSGGDVGIGTTSPEALLHLSKSSVAGEGAFIFIDNPAASTLGNKAGIRFATNTGATFSGYGSYIEAINTNAGNGAEDLTFGTWNGAARGERMRITSGGAIEATGSIKTGAPSGGTAKPWKLGARLSGTCSASTTNYLEVEVDGTLYYLAFAVPL